MNKILGQVIEKMRFESITSDRINELNLLIDFLASKRDKKEEINLNFICTHNSRRSQFSQVWAKVASTFYSIPINSYSGGVEKTECNKRVIASLKRFGFMISTKKSINPKYIVSFDDKVEPIVLFSKMYNDKENPSTQFGAIMTCSHADENCPYIIGSEARIPIRYDDPKDFDDTPLETSMYDYRSFQIATELFYVFSKIN
jgi:arsenate reductase (thioredoxin)